MDLMLYRLLADLVVVLHLGFILFVIAGGLFVLRWRWVALVHIPAATWGFLIELRGWICPLTPLENWLRRKGGAAGYDGGFVEHYILPLIYPGELTRNVEYLIAALVLVLNIAVYWRVAIRWR